jgi:peptide/nickel transport system permease protein
VDPDELIVSEPPGTPGLATTPSKRESLAVYVLRRLAWGVFMLWLVATLTFIALRLAPGGPLAAQAGPGVDLSGPALAAAKARFGLDHPVVVQYFIYLGHVVRGDLGTSYVLQLPVTTVLGDALPSTLALTASALFLSWVIALTTALLTAKRSRAVEEFGRSTEITMASLPDFWLGLLLLMLFGFTLHWVPVAAGSGVEVLLLPALALAIPLGGYLGQVTRQSFEDALDQPFTFTARSRGQSRWGVRARHGLRHAALPGVSLSGVMVGWLISGSVAVEAVYNRRGIGSVLLSAVDSRDYPVVLGCALVLALTYVVVNLVIDLLYPLIDPRLKSTTRAAAR